MKTKIIILLFIIAFGSIYLAAQSNYRNPISGSEPDDPDQKDDRDTTQVMTRLIPDIIPQIASPPSPDAAALGKYGQYPVSLCNGLVQIEIPLYEIKLPKYSLPVSLSYHASGIKVDEISSVVGLGWVLNAGGVITRSVRGMPDGQFGISYGMPIRDEQWVNTTYANSPVDKIDYLWNWYNGEQWGFYDTESDVYYYNVCDISGSFRLDKDGNLIQIPLTDNKIELYTNNTFKITGSDGTVYIFMDQEKSCHFFGPSSSSMEYISSWYLTSIITTDNRQIDFEYSTDNTQYFDHYPIFTAKVPIGLYYNITYPFASVLETHECLPGTIQTFNTLRLSTIIFPEGSISFNYTDDRADLRKYRLTGISIRDKTAHVKAFSFNHSYFMTNTYSGKRDYRLKLDEVNLLDKNHYFVSNYRFDYNTSALLPPYLNFEIYTNNYPSGTYPYFGQDYWGYYNGVTTNKNFYTYYKNMLGRYYTFNTPEADRTVNSTYAQACILKKITYPSGGYTEFQFEGNQNQVDGASGGLRIKNIISYSQSNSEPVIRSYQYGIGFHNSAGSINTAAITSSYTQGVPYYYFVLGPLQDVMVYDYYSSQPNVPLSHSGGTSAFYTNVTEFEGFPEDSNGKTEYSFLYSSPDVAYVGTGGLPTTPIIYHTYTFLPRLDYQYRERGWTRGKQTQVAVYKKVNGIFSLVKKTQYFYTTFKQQTSVIGFKSFSNYNSQDRDLGIQGLPYFSPEQMFQYRDIKAETGLLKLTEVRDSTYLNGDIVAQITNYNYDNLNNQYEVSSIYQKNSDNSIVKKNFKYPKDINVAPYTTMSDRNMLSQVIITTDSLDSKFIEEHQTLYSTWSNTILNPMIAPSGTTVKRGTNATETEYTTHNYDKYGNPLYISTHDADDVVYLWGYNYQYPIAEIKNATYEQVQANLGGYTVVERVANADTLNTVDFNALNYLRSQLPNALVTTYTYKPLVGIQTMTDPRGIVTKYEYDSFGRLQAIKDDNDKIIERYDYHYKSP